MRYRHRSGRNGPANASRTTAFVERPPHPRDAVVFAAGLGLGACRFTPPSPFAPALAASAQSPGDIKIRQGIVEQTTSAEIESNHHRGPGAEDEWFGPVTSTWARGSRTRHGRRSPASATPSSGGSTHDRAGATTAASEGYALAGGGFRR
jgi:hypothetical protein